MDVAHGTPEGYRLHKRNEHEPCPACSEAMAQLLSSVRRYQAQVRGSMGPVAAPPLFSELQRAWWPALRARDVEPLPSLPPVMVPATVCSGEEPWMPRSPKALAKKARAAGWWTSITRAIGPRIDAKGQVPVGREQVATIAVAVARGDHRLIWVWKYDDPSWKLDEVYWNKEGLINDKQGKAVLDGTL